MQTAGAIELGYASAAVLTALIRRLVRENVLTQEMAKDVLRDGIAILQPNWHITSVQGAISLIQTGFEKDIERSNDS
jgi:hypothetical protein